MIDNDATLKRKQRNKRKAKKIALLFLLTGITAVLLIVETYAWFIGTATVETNTFEIGVTSGDALELSLNGSDWTTSLSLSKDGILGDDADGGASNAYTGHTNIWPLETTGLIPISTDGASDPSANGRLKLYGKSSLTATGGGYRLISTRIDNYSAGADGAALVDEQNGYVAFDLFIRNGTGVDYIETYNQLDDEALYLTTNSAVTAAAAGEPDYGLANSVRVAFVQIGRVPSATADAGDITSIACTESATPAAEGVNNTSLCNVTDTTIWEPNEKKHDARLVTYFNKVCKKKTSTTGEGGTPVVSYSNEVCEALTATSGIDTYVVNQDIKSSDNVDIYDGINGATSTKLTNVDTFTDEEKLKEGAERPAFFYIAPNSVTKVRVYIYLEGQDVDNYDLASLGNSVSINFGFTKDQWDLDPEDLATT